ncbi:MAG: DNA repair protein RadA [Bacteroidetes bacterium]|nr:DNA repair protein RadA [Bacteroidota bacterium]
MAKIKTAFFCGNCGAQSAKWIGKCPACGEWNTYTEEVIQRESSGASSVKSRLSSKVSPQSIDDIEYKDEVRISSKIQEFDRVLGGGIVPGSLVLIGGEPGIGKSTIMLQLALQDTGLKTLYVSGEESPVQIKMRAQRLGYKDSSCLVLTETDTSELFRHIAEINPGMIIVDSIQTLTTPNIESSAGSISQIRECAHEFQKFAKETSTPVFLIGHITKDGSLAGPKILEHMVDTVLQFEGDHNNIYRILRAMKNRFGSTSELGIFEMRSTGLREVLNPSEMLISHHDEPLSGVAVGAIIEGIRPILIETQALVSSAAYGTPQRSATGFDTRRLNMLLAVLEKRCGFRIGIKDVFLNITGGLKISDPAADLSIICSILSSAEDIPVNQKACFAAEIGLTGELRPVMRVEQRIAEAEKLGFEEIYVSKYNTKGLEKQFKSIKIIPVLRVDQLFSLLFG